MSLEGAFRRLSLWPSNLCHQCKRTFASSRPAWQQQSAAAALNDMLRSSPRQADTQRSVPARPARPAVPTTTPSSAPSAAPQTSHELARAVLAQASSPEARQRQQLESSVRQARNDARADLERQAIRRWKVGDVYAPHDLTGLEMAKWKKLRRKGKLKWDVVDLLGVNPIDHYKNFSMMSEYMSEMGRIKHSKETSLRPVNQRRMAKAVRRAIGCGLMPGVHRHPEVLRLQLSGRRAHM